MLLLPAIVLLLGQGLQRLRAGLETGDVLLVTDGALTLLIEGGTQVLVLVLMLRSRRGWVRDLRQRMAAPGETEQT